MSIFGLVDFVVVREKKKENTNVHATIEPNKGYLARLTSYKYGKQQQNKNNNANKYNVEDGGVSCVFFGEARPPKTS